MRHAAWTSLALLLAVACTSGSQNGGPHPEAETQETGPLTKDAMDERMSAAKEAFFEAVDGEEGALARAKAALEALLLEEPEDPQVVAYVGSLRLLESREATLPWNKGSLAKEGLALLDRAVEEAPEDLEIRYVRGISSQPLPGFFGRTEEAAEDITFVATRAEGAVAEGRLSPSVAAAALYRDGLRLEKASDTAGARKLWEKAVTLAPGSKDAVEARKKLEGATAE